METEQETGKIIEEYFADSEYKLIDAVFRGEKGTRVLEIYVDNKDGINIDELTRINKELNVIVDNKLILDDISKLVVSSPGAERPIKFFWQLNKHLGRILEIELNDGEKLEGKLTAVLDLEDPIISIEIIHRLKGKKVTTELKDIKFKEIKELKVKISFSKK